MTARRPDLERRLDQLPKATWTYVRALAVDRIDLPSSSSLQYRLTEVDEATVDRYAADMERGDVFPAVVVREVRGKLSLIGGNHRRAAADQAGISTLPAYVVVCSAAQARQLAYEDNRTHGLPLKPSERATLGARLVLLDGVAASDAAATVGATEPQVWAAVRAERAATRADQLGLPSSFAAMPHQTRNQLGAIEDDGLFAEAVRTALASNMGGGSVQSMCARIAAATDIDDAFDRLDAIAAAREGHTGGRGVKKSQLNYLSDHAFGILDVDPAKAAAGVAPGDELVWRERLKRVARHIMAIDHALGART